MGFHNSGGGGGGEKLIETILWTNSSPTSSFNTQSVTLSETMRNYDYLKFDFRSGTTNDTVFSNMVEVNSFINVGDGMIGITQGSASVPRGRRITYASDTSVTFSNTIPFRTEGGSTQNSDLIPILIFGVNKQPKPTQSEVVLWTNPSPTSSFSNQTVTLSESYTNFKYVGVKYATGTGSSAPEATMILSTEDAAKTNVSGSNNGVKGAIGSRYTNNTYARIIGFMSNTSVEITDARLQSGTNTNNALIIPKTIIGIN